MTRMISKLSMGLAALVVSAGLACAQTTGTQPAPGAPPAATAPAKTTTAKGVQKKASTPEGIACSAEADKQQLHGKARKSFRSKCIRDAKAKAGGTTPAAAPAPATAPATPPPAAKK